ncbi:unnamed protein product [Urochloa decumbens]|uniref:Uncharacterized protein n=1 Tax=Urochloa decumbens TaxID=240449 RepID=A0ABC8WIE5_9POAL
MGFDETETEMEMGRMNVAGMVDMVWGRRRAAAPPEEDEFERSRSTKAKNDRLSVYEATMLKLRRGSVQAFTAAPPDGTTNGGGDDGAAAASAQNKQTN